MSMLEIISWDGLYIYIYLIGSEGNTRLASSYGMTLSIHINQLNAQ